VSQPSFGVSTHLYHDERLSRDHLVEIAAHGFEAIELFANRPHFDATEPDAVDQLEESLRDTGLRLHSVHAPIAESLNSGRWTNPLSLASAEPSHRERALVEAGNALRVAGRLGAAYLVVHVGVPTSQERSADDNRLAGAVLSLEALQEIARPLGVRLALELIPNALSGPEALVTLLEDGAELDDAGICFDFGHAYLMGDLVDAIETTSGHVVTTHVHDNTGRGDEHLMPFDGRIDWDAALMGMQKIGYEGAFVFEPASSATPRTVLERAQQVRRKLERLLLVT
jgi:sugar phosphate isomerase/epimerase